MGFASQSKKDSVGPILHLLFTLQDCKQDVLELKNVVVLQIQLAVSEILTTVFKIFILYQKLLLPNKRV